MMLDLRRREPLADLADPGSISAVAETLDRMAIVPRFSVQTNLQGRIVGGLGFTQSSEPLDAAS